MSDRASSIRILDDARRLNMMDGHFVWLWIDTAAVISVKDNIEDDRDFDRIKRNNNEGDRYRRDVYRDFEERNINKADGETIRHRRFAEDIDEMNINYLLQNDQYLLFNRNYGVESSKSNAFRGAIHQRDFDKQTANSDSGELPSGLLSLKALPVKVDRHLVKGAVRLLVSTLKVVLQSSPEWMIRNLANGDNNGCWKTRLIKESGFISNFAR